MNKTILFASLALVTFLLFANCSNREEIKTLEQQTEAIHDEAMLELVTMKRTRIALRKELSVVENEAENPLKDHILTALAEMKKADDDMAAWMLGYKAPTEDTPKDKALSYLQEQKAFMEKNKADIRAATEAGNRILEQLQAH